MKLKFSFILFFIFFSNLYAINLIVAKNDISYNSLIKPTDLLLVEFEKKPNDCIPITLEKLKANKYFAKKYLREKKIICEDDLKTKSEKSIIFNFGSIEIETNGKIMFENDEYIKIRKNNGDIEKIYKDGRVR